MHPVHVIVLLHGQQLIAAIEVSAAEAATRIQLHNHRTA